MTQSNSELHNRIIQQIEDYPDTWNQFDWHCGSAHCYGGWGQLISGISYNTADLYGVMTEKLGLTYSQAEYAFEPERTLEELKDLPDYVMDTGGYSENGYDHLGYDKDGFNKYGCA